MTGVLKSGPRYFGGAVLCALINNVILIVGAHFGLADAVGVAIAWAAGGTTGYVYHTRVTFTQPLRLRAYGQFMAGMILGVPLTWLLITVFRRGFGWPMEFASPATTVLLFAYNFANARLAIAWPRRGKSRSAT